MPRRPRSEWLLLATLLVMAGLNAGAQREGDLVVYHRAAHRVLAGERIYRAEDGYLPFKYAPVVAVLLAPIGALPIRVVKLLWELGAALCLFVFFRWAAAPPARPIDGFWALALLLPQTFHLLSLVQIDPFLLALMVASERMAGRRPVVSGLLWSVAVLTKPPYLMFALPAVVFGERRRLASLLAGIAVGLCTGALLWGFRGNLSVLAQWQALLGGSTRAIVCDVPNQSVWALACTLGPFPAWSPGYFATVAALALVPVVLAVLALGVAPRVSRSRRLASCAAFAGATLLSPLGWWGTLVGIAPMVVLLCVSLRDAPAGWRRWTAAAALLVLLAAAVLTRGVLPEAWFGRLLALRHLGWAAYAAVVAAICVRASLTRAAETGR